MTLPGPVMRGGPGLGNIAPEQSDIKLACRGLGHGNTHAIVLDAVAAILFAALVIAWLTVAVRTVAGTLDRSLFA